MTKLKASLKSIFFKVFYSCVKEKNSGFLLEQFFCLPLGEPVKFREDKSNLYCFKLPLVLTCRVWLSPSLKVCTSRWRHNQIFSHVYTDMTYQNQINVFTFFLVLEGDLHVINTLWSTNQRFCFILDQTFVILDSVLQLLGKKIDMTANLKYQLSRNRIWQALKKYGAVNPEINQGKP